MDTTPTNDHAAVLDAAPEAGAPATAGPTRRLWRLAAGWGAVALLAGYASWRGAIAMDLMLAIMEVVGWFSEDEILDFPPDWWGALRRLAAVGLAAGLAVATLRYQRRSRGACPRCGRVHRARAWDQSRMLVLTAYATAVPALAYAALKLYWGFGGTAGLNDPTAFEGVRPWSPGMGDTAVMALIGVGIALAMAYRWPPRLPRWLLLAPAVVGCLMLLPAGLMGTGALIGASIAGNLSDHTEGLALWVVVGIYPAFLVWGLLLSVVTVGYHYATRAACQRCGQG